MNFGYTTVFFITIALVLASLFYLWHQSQKIETYCIDEICITDAKLFHAQCSLNTCVYNLDSPKGIQTMTHYRSWSFAGDCIYVEFGTCQNYRLFYDNQWTRQDVQYQGVDLVILGRKI